MGMGERSGEKTASRATSARDAASVAAVPDVPAVLEILRRAESGTGVIDPIVARAQSRMRALRIDTLPEYVGRLRDDAAEAQVLHRELQAAQSRFFRNDESWDLLTLRILPRLLQSRMPHEKLRVWCLGCATGEEAYSLAIACKEYCQQHRIAVPIKLLATDTSEASIEFARAACYPESIAREVSAERLRRHFVKVAGGYRVSKSIRELCVFSRHDALADPPFSRIDLLACRNVLSLLAPQARQRMLSMFELALSPNGCLWIGNREVLGAGSNGFERAVPGHAFHFRKGAPLPLPGAEPAPAGSANTSERLARELTATRDYLQSMLAQHESLYEELQTANADAQSANKDLQRSNRLLKSSRKKIQDANKALLARSGELQQRTTELNHLHSDLVNVLDSVQTPIVILGADLRIRRATQHARKLFGLEFTAVGERLADFKPPFEGLPDFLALVRSVLASGQVREHDVRDRDGHWYSLRAGPYRRDDGSIDGAILMLVDTHRSKVAELAMAHFGALVASSDDAIISKDLNGIITSWNGGAERIFGYRPDEIIGKSVTILMPLERVSEEADILRRIRSGESIRHFETVRQCKDGRLLDISLTVSPILDRDGVVIGASKIARDISAEKRAVRNLRQSERRFRALFASSVLAVYSCDAHGNIQEFNARAAELWGQSPSRESRFSGALRIYSSDGTPLPRDRSPMARLLRGEVATVRDAELQLERPDGTRVTVQCNIVPVTNEQGERTGAVNCFYDITERRNFEAALERYASKLAAIDRRKNEFLAVLGHELRNPLAPIRNAVQLLQRGADANRERLLDMLSRQTGLLARLVDDLLDAGRLANGRIELRRANFELCTLLRSIAEDFRGSHDPFERRLVVDFPDSALYVYGDVNRFMQVVANLLHNAYKFTDPGGCISLLLQRSGTQASIIVRDDGIGLAPDHVMRIFDMFGQVSDPSRPSPGLGIGLALGRVLVEMHGGSLQARSEGIGRGSEFILELPLVQAPAQPALPAQATTLRGQRVMVVDDNRDAAESLAQLLELDDNQTLVASDGEAALANLAGFAPDVVLMDIGMPGMDGYDTARHLRALPAGAHAVLVAVSGWGSPEHRHKSASAGFDGHLVKPVDYAELARIVAQTRAERG